MISLVIEATGKEGFIALFSESTLLSVKRIDPSQEGNLLVAYVEEELLRQNLKPSDLTLLIVGSGPGRFTSMRVSAAIMKTLSRVLSIPLVSISSFYAYLEPESLDKTLLFDGKREGVILFSEEKKKSTIVPWEELSSQLLRQILVPDDPPFLEKVRASLGCEKAICLVSPKPEHLFREGVKAYREKRYTVDGSMELIYTAR